MERPNRCLIMVVVLLLLGGCARYQRWTPPGEAKAGKYEDIDVLTRDGTIYHFIRARIDPEVIDGLGIVFAPPDGEPSLTGDRVDPPDDQGEAFRGSVPMSEVVLIQTNHRDKGSGLVVIAAVAVLATAVSEFDDPGGDASVGRPGSGGGSCPYVYAFDGNEYRLDAEPFVGAVARELEETTRSVLPHLAVSEGRATVALCNQAPESQYLNSIRLLAVDHPPGSRLVLDTAGEMVAVDHEQPPATARDVAGDDVLPLVAARDGRNWSTDRSCIDPDQPASLVDGIVCEFAIPDTATVATLVLGVGNSDLGEFVTHEILGEGGTSRLAWYRDLANDPMRPALVTGAMKRLGGLIVEAWSGARWRRIDLIPVVGGVVPVERAVTTELTGEMDGTLRVRLRGAAGLWRIDEVAVAFEATVPEPPVRLDAADFQSTRPGATIALLAETDGDYLALFPGDWAVVQFDAPDAPTTGDRTFVIEACGHYYPWARAASNADPPRSRGFLPDGGEVYREWLEPRPEFTPPGAPPELPRPVAIAS